MNFVEFFLKGENWSLLTACMLGLPGVLFISFFKLKKKRLINFMISIVLIFMVLGSPLMELLKFGLHSVFMVQQIIMLLVVPVFLWQAIPPELDFSVLKNKKNSWVLAWLTGALAMWAGHFISAYKLSALTGIPVCGITASGDNWTTFLPLPALLFLTLFAGMVFARPVFHPDNFKRIAPLNRVAYLFTSCVSCSILGLWVAFSAALTQNAIGMEMVRAGSPVNLSMQTDQELAGMIMWVPGCVLYVAASAKIMFNWLEENETLNLKQEYEYRK